MIKKGKVYCDNCGKRMMALKEDECLEDMSCHGWTNYKTAEVHFCDECYHHIFLDWKPPCYKCYSHRCERGIECWAYPPDLNMLPYETYYASRYHNSWKITLRRAFNRIRRVKVKRQDDDLPF